MRLLQVTLPEGAELTARELEELFESGSLISTWTDDRGSRTRVVQLAVAREETEAVMDALEQRFGGDDGFRAVLLPVEAMIPRFDRDEDEEETTGEPSRDRRERISREELYADVTDGLRPSPVFVSMVVLSTIVAAVGLLRDDITVLIGAMVIAPLLRPNVALTLAATLGDIPLAWRSIRVSAVGVGVALILSLGVGFALEVDPAVPAIALRTSIGVGDLALALAAGAAGALAFTRGLPGPVIGVMVAVALLPPLVVFGVLLGDGLPRPALGALQLAVGNLICLNLAAIATFLVQGVRPRTWWETERAKRATRLALAVWTGLLAALVLVLWLA